MRRRGGEGPRRVERGSSSMGLVGEPFEVLVQRRRDGVDLDRAVGGADLPRARLGVLDALGVAAKRGERPGCHGSEQVADQPGGQRRETHHDQHPASQLCCASIDVAERCDQLDQCLVTRVGDIGDLDGVQPPTVATGLGRRPPRHDLVGERIGGQEPE